MTACNAPSELRVLLEGRHKIVVKFQKMADFLGFPRIRRSTRKYRDNENALNMRLQMARD
jgi:hypothetical protein